MDSNGYLKFNQGFSSNCIMCLLQWQLTTFWPLIFFFFFFQKNKAWHFYINYLPSNCSSQCWNSFAIFRDNKLDISWNEKPTFIFSEKKKKKKKTNKKLDVSKVHKCPCPMAFAYMDVSFGPTPQPHPTIQCPNPDLCINYFICDHYTRFLTF